MMAAAYRELFEQMRFDHNEHPVQHALMEAGEIVVEVGLPALFVGILGGWLLTPFLAKVGLAKVVELRDRVAAGLGTIFASQYTAEVTLTGALQPDAVSAYSRQATGQKYLITPNG